MNDLNTTHWFGSHRLKRSYVTRTMTSSISWEIGNAGRSPRRGDLVVARVARLGDLDHLEDPYGRRTRLYEGNVIIGAYGDRYATDFYEGYARAGRLVHLLTAGGLIGTVVSAHDACGEPTALEVLGAPLSPEGQPLSLDCFARPIADVATPPIATVAVLGSGMNAGKTTTVVSTVRGLASAGLRVGAGKVTGSGSGKDRWAYIDAGADPVLDFLDFGMSSTFGYPLDRLARTMVAIRSGLAHDGADVVVLEIADGILQSETAFLLERLAQIADAVIFAAVDALSACLGLEMLRQHQLPVCAISGLVTRSPLASREIDRSVPVLSASALAKGDALTLLPERAIA